MNEERKRILNLLAEGQLTAEEAESLLSALEETPAAAPEARSGPAPRLLRLYIHDMDGTEVRVNLPLALARFALKFIPKEQQQQIAEAGFDLDELLASLRGDMPEGKLVEIHDPDGTEVLIEVV